MANTMNIGEAVAQAKALAQVVAAMQNYRPSSQAEFDEINEGLRQISAALAVAQQQQLQQLLQRSQQDRQPQQQQQQQQRDWVSPYETRLDGRPQQQQQQQQQQQWASPYAQGDAVCEKCGRRLSNG